MQAVSQIAQARKEKIRQEKFLKGKTRFLRAPQAPGDADRSDRVSQTQSVRSCSILDVLSDCVQRTDGLWLKRFVQKDNLITLSGWQMGRRT